MNLMETAQLLGNLGEFVGAIAVVGTLVYLSVQVGLSRKSLDENTLALEETKKLTQEGMLYQLSERWDKISLQVVENREIGSVFVRGNAAPDDLDDVDRKIYESRVGLYFNTYFMFHRMAEAGLLDADIIEYSDRTFQADWGVTQGARKFWEDYKTLWPDAYGEHVDALLSETNQPQAGGES